MTPVSPPRLPLEPVHQGRAVVLGFDRLEGIAGWGQLGPQIVSGGVFASNDEQLERLAAALYELEEACSRATPAEAGSVDALWATAAACGEYIVTYLSAPEGTCYRTCSDMVALCLLASPGGELSERTQVRLQNLAPTPFDMSAGASGRHLVKARTELSQWKARGELRGITTQAAHARLEPLTTLEGPDVERLFTHASACLRAVASSETLPPRSPFLGRNAPCDSAA